MDMNFTRPSIGPIYAVANNDSMVNITLNYPLNYQFDNLTVNFTIYEYMTTNTTFPVNHEFSQINFDNSNISLPWVVPPVNFQTGSYLIICFEWIQTNYSGFIVNDTYDCTITRTVVNGAFLSMDNPIISAPLVGNTTVMTAGYFPRILPFDQVNITAMLNSTIMPAISDSTSNDSYSYIRTFTFQNLVPDTTYILCTNLTYVNSLARGFSRSTGTCQTLNTVKSPPLNRSYSRYLPNIMLIILCVLFVSI